MARKLKGEVMVLELAQHVQTFLHAYNQPPAKSFYEQMLTNKRKQEEKQKQEQQRKMELLKKKEEKQVCEKMCCRPLSKRPKSFNTFETQLLFSCKTCFTIGSHCPISIQMKGPILIIYTVHSNGTHITIGSRRGVGIDQCEHTVKKKWSFHGGCTNIRCNSLC